MRKSPLRGGLYHIALMVIAVSSFNWGFERLTGVNIVRRVFSGFTVPDMIIALSLCVSSVIVLWNNWVD